MACEGRAVTVFWFTLRVIATAYVLLVLYAAAMLLLEYWRERRKRPRECTPQDVVLTALHSHIMVRPADRTLEHHHPLGHRTMSVLMLPEDEWNLWLSVMQEQIR